MNGKQKNPAPRNGHTLVVGVVARISGGQRQKERSLDDQQEHAREVIGEMYAGEVEYIHIATKAKGERLDRKELRELEKLLRSRRLDILFAEDLGRIIRGSEATRIVGLGVDHGVRTLCPNDCIDTDEESWEEDVISASRDHVGHNAHTSRRIKKKLMIRFLKLGGAPARPIFGYIVPEDAKTYHEWRKDEQATKVYEEWFQRLRERPNCSRIADWLNKLGVPRGPYARKKKWTGKAVRAVTGNALLKGMPGRGYRHMVKHNQTGGRKSVLNPKGPSHIEMPHLAHVSAELWDEVNAILRKRNTGLGRKPVNGIDPRKDVLRKKTIWPGQHILCGVCGRLMYWGGHGQKDHMMCSGVLDYLCWNTATFDGMEAGPRLMRAFLGAVETLPEFGRDLHMQVNALAKERNASRDGRMAAALKEIAKCEMEGGNITDAIARIGYNHRLEDRLKATEVELQDALRMKARLERETTDVAIPSIDALKGIARKVSDFAFDSYDFHEMMHRMAPRIAVLPYRPRDGKKVVFRARMEIDLAPLAEGAESLIEGLAATVVTVDLFGLPQRIAQLNRVIQLRTKVTQAKAAEACGLTVTAAQNSAALHRLMNSAGSQDPFVFLEKPLSDSGRMKRHLHPRYDFTPLEGFPMRP